MTVPMRILSIAVLAILAGCQRAAPTPIDDHDHDHDHPEVPSDRIATPPQVRQNLGITFVRAERRRVAATLRVPGQFEQVPGTRHEYRTPVAGRVTLATTALQTVQPGDVIYSIDAPAWRAAQRELGELAATITVTQARVDAMQPLREAHERHEQSLRAALTIAADRLVQLQQIQQDVGGQANELAAVRLKEAELRAELAEVEEKDAELAATAAEQLASLAAGKDRFALMLATAATLAGRTVAELSNPIDGVPAWRRLDTLQVRANAAGIVDHVPVASGAQVDAGGLVVAIRDPKQLRFLARGLQSDLSRLRDGLPARVLWATSAANEPAATGTLQIGTSADAQARTVDLYVTTLSIPANARPGLAGFLEVETTAGGATEMAVPSACVLTDGLQRVLFRRDPRNPDQVIRSEADCGLDDGRWIEIKSGLAEGDEVVLAGAYELMLASSGAAPKGGHFHADGTFHAEGHK